MRKTGLFAPLLALYGACDPAVASDGERPLTRVEAKEAVARINELTRDHFALHFVEISTDGNVGDRLEQRRDRMRAFLQSQLDCMEFRVEGETVLLDFGTLEDDCVFRGHTYAGVDAITSDLDVELDRLDVTHEFSAFSNGEITLDGALDVSWSGEDDSRHIAAQYALTDFQSAELVSVQGDYTVRPLDPERSLWEGGFSLEGAREWTVNGRAWSAETRDLEVLLSDPAPMGGTLSVTSPEGQEMNIRYSKQGDVIFARVTGPAGQSWVFVIHSDGEILQGGSS